MLVAWVRMVAAEGQGSAGFSFNLKVEAIRAADGLEMVLREDRSRGRVKIWGQRERWSCWWDGRWLQDPELLKEGKWKVSFLEMGNFKWLLDIQVEKSSKNLYMQVWRSGESSRLEIWFMFLPFYCPFPSIETSHLDLLEDWYFQSVGLRSKAITDSMIL